MANLRLTYVMSAAFAEALRAATANTPHRLDAPVIELGPHAGKSAVPGDVFSDPRYSTEAKEVIPSGQPLLVLDYDLLWTQPVA